MKKYDFFLVLRLLIYVLEFFLIYSLEQIPGLSAEIYGVRPLILVPFFVSAAVFENELVALSLGIVCGFLADFSFGTTVGSFVLILCLIGYFIGVLFRYFIKINLFSAMVLNFFILAIVVFLKDCFKLGFQNNFCFWNEIFFPVICYSGVLFPLAYFFNRYVFYKFSEKRG